MREKSESMWIQEVTELRRQNTRYFEVLSLLIGRLDEQGGLDPIREEAPIQDARDVLAGDFSGPFDDDEQ